MMPTGWIAAVFALFGTLSMLLLATIMPPFQNPDEGAHFARADQVGHLGLMSRCGAAAPALIDSGALEGGTRFMKLAFTKLHVTRDLYAPLAWGHRVAACMPNTSIYPPTFYSPAAIAIDVGRSAGLTVLPTLEMARAATGLASVAIAAVAIALAGPAAIWIFAVLTLPMSLAQTAAVSQDGPMFACAALAAALTVRLQDLSLRRRHWFLAVLCGAIALIGMARPPYAVFAVLPLLMPGFPGWLRALAATLILVPVAAWASIGVRATGIDLAHFGAGTDAGAQAMFLLRAPWRVLTVAYETLATYGTDYLEGFIGKLGWLDVSLPGWYVWIGWGAVILAGAASWTGSAGKQASYSRGLIAASVLAACIAMFVIQFFTWTRVGNPVVDGIQGRYFIVPALIAVAALATARPSGSRLAAALSWPVLLFPIVSIVVTLHSILLRYYL